MQYESCLAHLSHRCPLSVARAERRHSYYDRCEALLEAGTAEPQSAAPANFQKPLWEKYLDTD